MYVESFVMSFILFLLACNSDFYQHTHNPLPLSTILNNTRNNQKELWMAFDCENPIIRADTDIVSFCFCCLLVEVVNRYSDGEFIGKAQADICRVQGCLHSADCFFFS